MIFPNLTLETVIQVEDKTRFDASKSFISGDSETITDVLIQPEASESFISVYNADSDKWYLDWAYVLDGVKTVIVKVTTDIDPVGRTRSYSVTCLTEEEDVLFSDDSDLISYEPDIEKYLRSGKSSFMNFHRKAQDIIISYLDEQKIWKNDNSRIRKQDIADITDTEVKDQFRQWSTYQTLLLIFESIKVSNTDIFDTKKENYKDLRNGARKRSALRLDLDGDMVTDSIPYDFRAIRLVRR